MYFRVTPARTLISAYFRLILSKKYTLIIFLALNIARAVNPGILFLQEEF